MLIVMIVMYVISFCMKAFFTMFGSDLLVNFVPFALIVDLSRHLLILFIFIFIRECSSGSAPALIMLTCCVQENKCT